MRDDELVNSVSCNVYINNSSGSKAVEVFYHFKTQYNADTDTMRYWVDFDGGCDLTSFAAQSSPTDPLAYDIGGPGLTLNIPSWTGSCGYTETLSFSPNLSSYPWISVLTRTITVSSTDTSLYGTS